MYWSNVTGFIHFIAPITHFVYNDIRITLPGQARTREAKIIILKVESISMKYLTNLCNVLTNLCNVMSKSLKVISLLFLAIIVVSIAAQVIFRYLFHTPLEHTDEIAQASMIWLTFLGSAYLYEEKGHITIHVLPDTLPSVINKILSIVIDICVASSMIYMTFHITKLYSLMSRIHYGTLQISKFNLHFIPLMICCLFTALFALNSVFKTIINDEE